MFLADEADHHRALLDGFLRVFHLKDPSLWRTTISQSVSRRDSWLEAGEPYKVTESLS